MSFARRWPRPTLSNSRFSAKRSRPQSDVARLNEAETRAEHVDPALKGAGWGEIEGSRVSREFHITQGRLQGGGKRSRPEIADYILNYRNTRLAVLEAKRWDLPYTEGAAQAKEYAKKLGVR